MFNNILIICTGNICRSPMAEALMAQQVAQLSLPAQISSAGLSALSGHPADPMAQRLLQEKGLDLSAHRGRQATTELLLAADLILTMESWQVKKIQYILPSLCGRIHRLGKWGEYDIFDPFQKTLDHFSRALALIEQGVKDWQDQIWNSIAKR